MPNKHSRICQFHFESRKPSRFKYDVDYAPIVFNFGEARKNESDVNSKLARYNRLQKQRKQDRRQTRDQSTTPLTTEVNRECDLQEDTQFVDGMPSVSSNLQSTLQDREAWQETVLQEQQGNGQSIDGRSSECQNLISNDDIEALEEVRLTTDEVFDLEKGLKSERVKVIGLENELKKKGKLHADLEVKFKEVNQIDLEKNNEVLLQF